MRPDGTLVAFDYDLNGNMTVLTNPKSIANSFDYTANDQRKIWMTPISGSYLYSYDKERKLKTIQFPSGKLITNTYTKGLLTGTTTPEGVTTFEYGCSDLLSKAIRGTETIGFTYDGTLLKTDTRTGLLNQSISYSYNNDYRLSSITYAGASYNLGYDSDGLLTAAGTFTIIRNSQNGLPEKLSDGTLINTRTFSTYGELDNNAYAISGINKYSYSLSRDLAGRIIQKVEGIGTDTNTYDYGYDANGRLTEVKKNNILSESYSYDGNGNRLTSSAVNYTYSNEDHIITAGADTYQFNSDGFLQSKTTSAGTTTFNYSSRGELLSATLPSGNVISYDNDPFGRRIAKRVNGSVIEKYLWKDAITLLAIYDGNNNLIMRFNYADGRLPVSMTMGSITYYLAYDQVGSLRAITDTSGNIVKRVDYDSFGNILLDTNPVFAIPFGFAGGLHDKDTGLVRFGLRDYDPSIGRWTAKDPIDFRGGDTNLYGYVNDPINWIDPWGLLSIEEVGNIIFNETRSLSGEDINSARKNIAHAIFNADDKWGEKRTKYAKTGPATVGIVPENEEDNFNQCQEAASEAYTERGKGIDPTNGAYFFNFRKNNWTGDFNKAKISTQTGPFNNSYPTTALPATGIYGNTYGGKTK